MKTLLRTALLGFLLSQVGFVFAQGVAVDTTPRSPAQSLSCLQRPSKPLEFPERHKLDHASGMTRVKLLFEKADAKPRVEVLANTAREDMQDLVFGRLAEYRLPCLTPEDGVVSAVQEFNFNNTDREPLAMEDEAQALSCLVMPREGMVIIDNGGRKVEHLMLSMVFDGDGEKPPKVDIVYSTNSKLLQRAAVNFASEYRMPCRSKGDKPRRISQPFVYRPSGVSMYALKREGFSLMEFLAMTEGIREVEANFDLNTMHCPFKVDYELYSPHQPNEVRTGGKPDPNRAAFLQWLSERQIAFENDKQARDLWGSTLQINVPCGVLKLEPRSAAG